MQRTVSAALAKASAVIVTRAADGRFTGTERTRVRTLRDQCDTVLAALANDRIPDAMRATIQSAIRTKVLQLAALDEKYALRGNEIYDALDLLWDVGDCLARGDTTFDTTLSDGT